MKDQATFVTFYGRFMCKAQCPRRCDLRIVAESGLVSRPRAGVFAQDTPSSTAS